jgi:hypothetical protein
VATVRIFCDCGQEVEPYLRRHFLDGSLHFAERYARCRSCSAPKPTEQEGRTLTPAHHDLTDLVGPGETL